MIKGIGVDVVELTRFKKIEGNQDFIKQVLNENEAALVLNSKYKHLQIAKIYAIKEAVLKAFGTGLYYGSFWHNIEVSALSEIKLSGYLKEIKDKLSINKINFSITYTKNILTAIVILE